MKQFVMPEITVYAIADEVATGKVEWETSELV